MSRREGLNDRLRSRLRLAGRRFHAAEHERREAITELKEAIQKADRNCSAEDAAELTGVSSYLLKVIQPALGRKAGG